MQEKQAILIFGPCRSGTTWVQYQVSDKDTHSYFQPFKHQVRMGLAKLSPSLEFNREAQRVVVKEALGPYHMSEVDFDPVTKMSDVYPNHHFKYVVCMNHPLFVLQSWKKAFGERYDETVFHESYVQTYKMFKNLCDSDAEIFPFCLTDVYGGVSPVQVSQALQTFSEMGQDRVQRHDIIKHRDPEQYEVKGLLDRARSHDALSFRALPSTTFTSTAMTVFDEFAQNVNEFPYTNFLPQRGCV